MSDIQKTKFAPDALKSTGFMGFSNEEIQLIKESIVPPETSKEELKAFLVICAKKKLDPFQRQIYLIPRWDSRTNRNKMSPQTSIDGYRSIAARTGQYAGSDDVVFDTESAPSKATATVYRMVNGVRCAFTASVKYSEFFPGEKMGFMWKQKRSFMLGLAAERQALKKGFPEETSGLDGEEVDMFIPPPLSSVDRVYVQAASGIEEQGSAFVERPVIITKDPLIEETNELRAELINLLIGKDGKFKGKVKDAKDWILQSSGKTFDKLTAVECQELIAAQMKAEENHGDAYEGDEEEIFK